MKQQIQKEMKKSSQNKKKDLISKEKSVYSKSALGKTWRQREKLWQKLTKKMESDRFKYLVGELDRLFSIYIRNRDNVCISCWWVATQNGHFISRRYWKYRWCDYNCHWQCYGCNVWKHWNYIPYTIEMIKRYWDSVVEDMQSIVRDVWWNKKPTVDELIKRIDLYKHISLWMKYEKILYDLSENIW